MRLLALEGADPDLEQAIGVEDAVRAHMEARYPNGLATVATIDLTLYVAAGLPEAVARLARTQEHRRADA